MTWYDVKLVTFIGYIGKNNQIFKNKTAGKKAWGESYENARDFSLSEFSLHTHSSIITRAENRLGHIRVSQRHLSN